MDFLPELQLACRFYLECVKPIVETNFPGISYAAALIGEGSGVLGFDTTLSRDHDWGPRLQLFVPENFEASDTLRFTLDTLLPDRFLGHAVRFQKGSPEVKHQVEIWMLPGYLKTTLGIADLNRMPPIGWLNFPENKLLYLTKGEVFHDDLNRLSDVRTVLSYYPKDVWYYLLASQWHILSEEMPFVGRCGDTGDDLGSRVIAARQVNRIMRTAFLLERQYAPYSKWLGAAFKQLKSFPDLQPLLETSLSATRWKEREQSLAEAYTVLVRIFNTLQIVPPVPVKSMLFHSRPYTIVEVPAPNLIQNLIEDEPLKCLPVGVGAIDQAMDNVAVLTDAPLSRNFTRLFASS